MEQHPTARFDVAYVRERYQREFRSRDGFALSNWKLSYCRRIQKALRLEAGQLLLDVGCGSSYVEIEFAWTGVRVVGADIASNAVRMAREEVWNQGNPEAACAFLRASADRLPFTDASVDGITCIAVLEHIRDDARALREIRRVLRPGGRVFIVVPNAYRRIAPVLWPWYLLHDRQVGHYRHYTEETLRAAAVAAGLDFVAASHTGHFPKLLQIALSRVRKGMDLERDGLWWKLERLDESFARAKTGLQLTMVLERRA